MITLNQLALSVRPLKIKRYYTPHVPPIIPGMLYYIYIQTCWIVFQESLELRVIGVLYSALSTAAWNIAVYLPFKCHS